jgi:hypothetical protein
VVATPDAVAAVRAWTRLDQAMAAFDRDLRARHGVTGRQLAVLRLVDEWGPGLTLADLRGRLVMHPATLGQLVDRLGLPLVVRVDAAGIALFRLGAERPGLLVRAGTGDAGGRVWLETADARETARVLDAAGVAPGEPFQVATGWVVEVADPWGNVLGFTDYTLRPALARP